MKSGIGIEDEHQRSCDQNTWFANRSSRTFGGTSWRPVRHREPRARRRTSTSGASCPRSPTGPVNGTASWRILEPGGLVQQPKATSLLNQFRQTSNSKLSTRSPIKLQAIQLNNMPIITDGHPGAAGTTRARSHFKGWPTTEELLRLRRRLLRIPTTSKVLTSHQDQSSNAGSIDEEIGAGAEPSANTGAVSTLESIHYTKLGDNEVNRAISAEAARFLRVALWVAMTLNFLLPRLMPGNPRSPSRSVTSSSWRRTLSSWTPLKADLRYQQPQPAGPVLPLPRESGPPEFRRFVQSVSHLGRDHHRQLPAMVALSGRHCRDLCAFSSALFWA